MSVNAVLYNNSGNKNINMTKLASSITQQINDVYSISGNSFVSKMDFNMRVVSSVDEIGERDHVFQVVDQEKLRDSSSLTKAMAEAYVLGLNVSLGTDIVGDLLSGANKRSVAHELGHTGELDDLNSYEKDRDNLMMQGARVVDFGGSYNQSIQLNHSQIKDIRDNYIHNKSNKYSPLYRDTNGIKRLK